jgi:hypothetical protein
MANRMANNSGAVPDCFRLVTALGQIGLTVESKFKVGSKNTSHEKPLPPVPPSQKRLLRL